MPTVKLSRVSLAKAAINRPSGYIEDVLSASEGHDETHVWLTQENYANLRVKYANQAPRCLAGTALKSLLAAFGINAEERGCKCKSRAAHMDAAGCDWCEANLDTIVGWLREEATKRGLPFLDAAGRLLVRRAIKNARKKALTH